MYNYVIVIEVINVDEIVINEMLILLERFHLKRFYHDLKGETLIGLLDTGYLNNELTYECIQYFERQSRKTCIETHRLLFYPLRDQCRN